MTLLELLTAIFNTLWQAAAITATVWLALRLLRVNAATRGVIWWAALLVVAALPLAPRIQLPGTSPPVTRASVGESVQHVYTVPMSESPAVLTLTEKPSAQWPFVVLSIWTILVAYRLAGTVRSFFYLQSVKRNAKLSDLPLPCIPRRARLLISREITSPMAVGFLHPAVVIPDGLSEKITAEEMEQILLHESAHLARRDDWWNLLARLVAALLALHPVAWFILRQIEYEREVACDDWVVTRTGSALPYAETLVHMMKLHIRQRSSRFQSEVLASGVFGRGSRIAARIEMLLQQGRNFSAKVSVARVVAGCTALCALAAASSSAPRLIAFARPNAATVAKKPAPPVLIAQANTPRAAAPPPAAPPSFEVASVKPTSGADYHDWIRPKVLDPQHFRARIHLRVLLDWAYNTQPFQLEAPDWTLREFYDVDARTTAPATEAEMRQMLQTLLADRFHLKMRREMREVPVYFLLAGKNGPKMKESETQLGDGDTHVGGGKFIARGATMRALSGILTDNLDRPVIDKTQLTGHYDFDMTFDFVESATWTPIGPILFTLVQDLGLKLEPQKIPSQILVVESLERPSAN